MRFSSNVNEEVQIEPLPALDKSTKRTRYMTVMLSAVYREFFINHCYNADQILLFILEGIDRGLSVYFELQSESIKKQ